MGYNGLGFGDGDSGTILEPNYVTKRFSILRDCNNNGIHDKCDIKNGYSLDENNDGIPDECINWAAADGSWSNPANWDVELVPNNNDDSNFAPTISGSDAEVDLDINVTVDAVRLLGEATLSLVDGDLTLAANGMHIDGFLMIEDGRRLIYNTPAELTGAGEVRLQGFDAEVASSGLSAITNHATLSGEGMITAALDNAEEGIVRADSVGFLLVTGNSKNNAGMFEAVDGATLAIWETTVDGNGDYVADGGEIQLTPGSTPATVIGSFAEVAGGGVLSIPEGNMSLTGDLVLNECRQSLFAPMEEPPSIEQMRIGSNVAGGCTPPKRSRLLLPVDPSNTAGSLAIGGSLAILTDAEIKIASHLPAGGVNLTGNFVNESGAPHAFDWDCGSLSLRGVAEQEFELADKDRGNAPWNFDDNFGIGTLEIASTATVKFTSQEDNTGDGIANNCNEALYVDQLNIHPGGKIKLSHGRVYYRNGTGITPGSVQTVPGGCGALVQMCTSGLEIDRDCDGDADLKEIAAFQRCFGRSCTSCDWADLDGSGIVDREDLAEFLSLGAFDQP